MMCHFFHKKNKKPCEEEPIIYSNRLITDYIFTNSEDIDVFLQTLGEEATPSKWGIVSGKVSEYDITLN